MWIICGFKLLTLFFGLAKFKSSTLNLGVLIQMLNVIQSKNAECLTMIGHGDKN